MLTDNEGSDDVLRNIVSLMSFIFSLARLTKRRIRAYTVLMARGKLTRGFLASPAAMAAQVRSQTSSSMKGKSP